MIAAAIRDEEQLPRQHLVFWSQAFNYYPKFEQQLDDSFNQSEFDVVNVHPLPDTIYRGRRYMLGGFMSKELNLFENRDFCLATQGEPQPCVLVEDNCASIYRDDVGWTIHRKRAWTALLNGCQYAYIDFSIGVGSEAGTSASRSKIRSWMRYLTAFVDSVDIIHAKPNVDWIEADIGPTIVSGLARSGEEYVAYLADAREIGELGAGEPLEGTIYLHLPAGRYAVSMYSPTTGQYSSSVIATGGKSSALEVPPFRHDLALRVSKRSDSA